MSLPRRRFLRVGSMFALAVGIPTKLAGVAFGRQADAPHSLPNAGPAGGPRGEFGAGSYLQHSTFSSHVNTTFGVRSASAAPLLLIRADDRRPAKGPGSAEAGGAECFSLVFRGSTSTPLQQGVYTLRHGALDDVQLLLAPVVSKDARARYYEAIINRRLPS